MSDLRSYEAGRRAASPPTERDDAESRTPGAHALRGGALDAEGLRRFLRGAVLIGYLIVSAYLFPWLLAGDGWMIATMGTALAVNLWLEHGLRTGRSLRTLALVAGIAYAALVLLGVVRAGGVAQPVGAWLVTLPLLGSFLFGNRGAWIFGAVATAAAIAMWAAASAWGPLPSHYPPRWNGEFQLLELLGVGVTVMLLTLVWRRQAQSERRRRAIAEVGVIRAVERMQDGLFVLEEERRPDGAFAFRTLLRNPAGERIVQSLHREELDLTAWFDRLPPDRRLERLFCDSGQIRNVSLRHPVTGHDYAVRADRWGKRLILTCRDVTHQREVQEELRRARTDALEASRAKSEFLANLSHELRTPMNGIIGLTETTLQTDLDPEQRECLQILHGCADTMLGVVNNLLDLAQIESGRMELCAAEFKPRRLVEAVREEYSAAAAERNLGWRCSIADEVPGVLVGDEARLRQVLCRLVDNALKFTSEGGVDLRLEVVESGAEHARVRFTVRDTGCGFDDAQLPRLVQRFRQEDASASRARDGIGIGLTLAHEIVTRMGGVLEASSAPGKGATLAFALDCGAPGERAAAPADLQALVGRRMLLVDDLASNLRVLAGQVRRMGCRYETAQHPQQALQALRKAVRDGDPFHVLISDQRMPLMSGMELGQSISEDGAFDDLAMVLLSSSCERGDARLARIAGFDEVLQKPVKYLDLKRSMLDVLGPAPAAGDDPPAQRARADEGPGDRERDAGPARILLAEDNAVNRKLAVRLLEREGYTVQTVANGCEALERVRAEPFDLVLMDCMMPGMDGYEATRRIRCLDGAAGATPVIAVTANAMLGDREQCLEAGMNDYLSKPLRREKVLPVVRRWLEQRASAGG